MTNFRELGGYEAAGGRHVKYGVFYRAPALANVKTPHDVSLYKKPRRAHRVRFAQRGRARRLAGPCFGEPARFDIHAITAQNGQEVSFDLEAIFRDNGEVGPCFAWCAKATAPCRLRTRPTARCCAVPQRARGPFCSTAPQAGPHRRGRHAAFEGAWRPGRDGAVRFRADKCVQRRRARGLLRPALRKSCRPRRPEPWRRWQRACSAKTL